MGQTRNVKTDEIIEFLLLYIDIYYRIKNNVFIKSNLYQIKI